VVRLVDKGQRLISRASSRRQVEIEFGRPDHEQALRCGRHQRRKLAEVVGVAEGAVGALRSEGRDHRLDIVTGHPDRVASQVLLQIEDLAHHFDVHGDSPVIGLDGVPDSTGRR
jgi:uncharacterized membrane-anchored protein